MFDEADQPRLADFVEKGLDVTIKHPVDAPPTDPERECIQRLMLTALRSEPVAEPQELRLVGRRQDRNHRRLDDLIFRCSDAERPLSALPLEYKSGAMVALDTLPFGRESGGPRGCPRDDRGEMAPREATPKTRGSLPRRSRSALQPWLSGRPCLRGPRITHGQATASPSGTRGGSRCGVGGAKGRPTTRPRGLQVST